MGWELIPLPAHGLRGLPATPSYLTSSSCSVFTDSGHRGQCTTVQVGVEVPSKIVDNVLTLVSDFIS